MKLLQVGGPPLYKREDLQVSCDGNGISDPPSREASEGKSQIDLEDVWSGLM